MVPANLSPSDDARRASKHAQDVAAILSMCSEGFRAAGEPATQVGDRFVTPAGQELPLSAVVVACLLRGPSREDWAPVIANYVEWTISGYSAKVDAVFDIQSVDLLIPHLRREDSLPAELWARHFAYAMTFSPALKVVLAGELDGLVNFASDQTLEGFDVARVGTEAVHRMWERFTGSYVAGGPAGARLHFVEGSDQFTASYAMDIDRLAGAFDPDSDRTHGLVFSVPRSNAICWVNLDGSAANAAALDTLCATTTKQFSTLAAPLSLELFWRRDGVTEIVSRVDDAGACALAPTPAFAQVLDLIATADG